jgi:hypothetical protein
MMLPFMRYVCILRRKDIELLYLPDHALHVQETLRYSAALADARNATQAQSAQLGALQRAFDAAVSAAQADADARTAEVKRMLAQDVEAARSNASIALNALYAEVAAQEATLRTHYNVYTAAAAQREAEFDAAQAKRLAEAQAAAAARLQEIDASTAASRAALQASNDAATARMSESAASLQAQTDSQVCDLSCLPNVRLAIITLVVRVADNGFPDRLHDPP